MMTLTVHIAAGSLGLVFGFIALYAAKGAALHRKSGMLFVYAMLAMCACGFSLAVAGNNAWTMVNSSAGLTAAYLVITSLTTVRPVAAGARRLHVGALLVALTICVVDLTFGFQAIANGGSRNGVPAFPYLLFGIVGLLGGVGDIRMLRSGPLSGAARLTRHLWRMSFALWIAALSFFIGQAKVIPQPIRIYPLLALPVVAVLLTLLYWLWRVRSPFTQRNRAALSTSTAAASISFASQAGSRG
jgi:hypothetical protein